MLRVLRRKIICECCASALTARTVNTCRCFSMINCHRSVHTALPTPFRLALQSGEGCPGLTAMFRSLRPNLTISPILLSNHDSCYREACPRIPPVLCNSHMARQPETQPWPPSYDPSRTNCPEIPFSHFPNISLLSVSTANAVFPPAILQTSFELSLSRTLFCVRFSPISST